MSTAEAEILAAGLQAYPTIFADLTTHAFTAEQDTDNSLELYDLKGALVRKIAIGTAKANQRYGYELRAEGLGKRLYLVRLTADTGTQTIKVIVEK
ncbi:T9SS type A sorting domain-containing protein [Pontibacter chitinilyticus]|uniref:T9SS type A sorting domain-containing protein n=1 Tax=Pontibacter chitinilyticus TaxID=2674989 RepID=UPI003219F6C5